MKLKTTLMLSIALLCAGVARGQIGEVVTSAGIEHTKDGAVSLKSVFPHKGLVDPHTWVENDTVYVFCGHDKSWRTLSEYAMDRWEVWSTTDLENWERRYVIRPTDTYIGDQDNCWAGDICKRNGKFYWIFSNARTNTGVACADKITGPYVDLLNRPLLEEGIIPGHVYDPEIFIDDDGTYTVSFSAVQYYFATLAEDMKSIITEPKPIVVMHKGKQVQTKDKSTLFKKGDWYYLLYGSFYAISKDLYGPYELQDNQLIGGHNSIFEWKGQHYLIYETGEFYKYYRGVGMKPIYFHEDGTISVYKSKLKSGRKGEYHDFVYSQTGWCAEQGTTLEWNKQAQNISGELSAERARISSIPYFGGSPASTDKLSFKLVNNSDATYARVAVTTYQATKKYWEDVEPIDWTQEKFVKVKIKPNSRKVQSVEIDFEEFGAVGDKIRQIMIEPASNASSGSWMIDDIWVR